jgi:hypothetical protein
MRVTKTTGARLGPKHGAFIGTANLQGSEVVCEPGKPLSLNLLHVTAPGEQAKAPPRAPSTGAPGEVQHFAIYSPSLLIDHGRIISAPDTIMTTDQWTLLYAMLQRPQYANNVEFPISVFEDEMKSTVAKSPASCRSEMDDAEAKLRAHVGRETEIIAALKSRPTTCNFAQQ